MNRPLLLAATLFLGGCYDADTWSDDYITAKCTRYEDCDMLNAYGGTVESCENFHLALFQVTQEQSENWCEEYDRGNARECIHELELFACEELEKLHEPVECEDTCPKTPEV